LPEGFGVQSQQDPDILFMNQISKFLQSRIDEGDFPSAVYLVAEKGEVKLQDALGFAVVEPEKTEAKIDTIYDLASLTKVLVTGLLCAKLIENGQLNLSDKLTEYFPEFDTDEKKEITILNLMTHSSGFKGWLPFYLISELKSQIAKIIASEELLNPINKKVVYSDLNFLVLGNVIEKIHGKTLDEVYHKIICESLNLQNTFFNPPKKLLNKIAASEKGNAFEKQTCLDLGYQISNKISLFRNQTIWGEVHDNNCYFMNGVAGHAGLFSNAFEVFKIARQFLAQSTTILKPETCQLFRTNFTPNLNQARSLAFQLAETEDSTASEALSKDSFGHLGFTGTSIWIEPSRERIFILLTNRTHHRELPLADLKEIRQTFHRMASDILG
jgi:CubicO group peptidase (beta-lactamase class C family)